MAWAILGTIATYSSVLLILGGLVHLAPKMTSEYADKKILGIIEVRQLVGLLSIAAGIGLIWK